MYKNKYRDLENPAIRNPSDLKYTNPEDLDIINISYFKKYLKYTSSNKNSDIINKDYYNLYLKYKNKYLKLKKQFAGNKEQEQQEEYDIIRIKDRNMSIEPNVLILCHGNKEQYCNKITKNYKLVSNSDYLHDSNDLLIHDHLNDILDDNGNFITVDNKELNEPDIIADIYSEEFISKLPLIIFNKVIFMNCPSYNTNLNYNNLQTVKRLYNNNKINDDTEIIITNLLDDIYNNFDVNKDIDIKKNQSLLRMNIGLLTKEYLSNKMYNLNGRIKKKVIDDDTGVAIIKLIKKTNIIDDFELNIIPTQIIITDVSEDHKVDIFNNNNEILVENAPIKRIPSIGRFTFYCGLIFKVSNPTHTSQQDQQKS